MKTMLQEAILFISLYVQSRRFVDLFRQHRSERGIGRRTRSARRLGCSASVPLSSQLSRSLFCFLSVHFPFSALSVLHVPFSVECQKETGDLRHFAYRRRDCARFGDLLFGTEKIICVATR